jgi:hypothetical protein
MKKEIEMESSLIKITATVTTRWEHPKGELPSDQNKYVDIYLKNNTYETGLEYEEQRDLGSDDFTIEVLETKQLTNDYGFGMSLNYLTAEQSRVVEDKLLDLQRELMKEFEVSGGDTINININNRNY